MDADIAHEEQRHDQAGNDARHEQLGHRRLGEGAVDDHAEARRQQDAERASRCQRSGGDRPVVVAADQLRQRDPADRGRGRDARAAHRCEHRAPRDIGLQQPAGQTRHQLREPAVDAAAQSADAQDLRHEHEQRHASEHEAVHAAPAHQPEAVEGRKPALQQQIEHRGHRDRERHRHPAH